MTLRQTTLPYVLGVGLLACVLAAMGLQMLSGTPLWSEYGPLSFAQVIFVGLLALPCAALAMQPTQRPLARLFWAVSAIGLALATLIEIGDLTIRALPESKAFDYPAAFGWSAAAVAMVLIERLGLALGRSRNVLRGAFLLHSVAFLADFADGGLLQLSSIEFGLLGSADEVLELLCLSGYILGVTLFAFDMAAGALWRPFDTEPRPFSQILAAAFNPSRAYAEAWLRRPAAERAERWSTGLFLHAAYRATRWSGRPRDLLNLAAQVAAWPAITVYLSVLCTWRNGAAIQRREGISIPRQVVEQFLFAFTLSITPRNYYVFELFLPETRAWAREYLQRFETKRGLYRFLKKHRYPETARSPLTDKADFIDHCLDAGIPTIPYFLLIGPQGIERARTEEATLPACDLFAKPNKGRGGGGAEKWRYLADGSYLGSDGQRLSGERLMQRFCAFRGKGGYLVQPVAANHPGLADLGNGVLTTVRLLTCRNESDGIEATNAVMRFPRIGEETVDNFHAGGLAAEVDLETGCLGPATDLGLYPAVGWRARHPDTGVAIVGRRLPRWEEAVDLALRAHETFPERVFVGWDLALLPEGWHLVEGNAAPDLDILQRTTRRPLGNRRFGRLLAHHTAVLLRETHR